MMTDLGIAIEDLHHATPIISGFLLGYVAVLPLLGRLSDIAGRKPVFLGCLGVFALGSLITASGQSVAPVVIGRTLQGLGGGGLVPVTLALVADGWAAERRGLPLGIVAAVQELGSVAGPLYGAAILAHFADRGGWRAIFWINLPIAALVAAGFWKVSRESPADISSQGAARFDVVGWTLLVLCVVASLGAIIAPPVLANNDTLGVLYGPIFYSSTVFGWITPLALLGIGFGLVFALWEVLAPAPIRRALDLRRVPTVIGAADWLGALLLVATLAAIVISFATADPSSEVISAAAFVLLPVALVCLVAFIAVERRSPTPLVDFAALQDRAAVGALLTNLAIGAGLMAALVDIPIFARSTVFPNSQLDSALVLVRLLAVVPIGALLGGLLSDRVGYRITAGGAMLLCLGGFLAMTTWSQTTLRDALFGVSWLHPSDPALVATGLGFGLAIAPVNSAILGAVHSAVHGLASALVVVARTIGMLIGLSLLTAIGLHGFYTAVSHLKSPQELCPHVAPTNCHQYADLLAGATRDELHAIFAGAAVAVAIGGLLAVLLLRRHPDAIPRMRISGTI